VGKNPDPIIKKGLQVLLKQYGVCLLNTKPEFKPPAPPKRKGGREKGGIERGREEGGRDCK
jgi:hypothetical protein